MVDWQIRRKLNFVSRIDQRESVIPQFLAKNLRNRLICVPIGIKVGTRILKIKRVFADLFDVEEKESGVSFDFFERCYDTFYEC